MSKMNFAEELYYLELQQIKEGSLSKQQIIDFIKDRTSIDYYCKECEKTKTFVQNKDYYTLIVNNDSDFSVYKAYDLIIENEELKYKKESYSSSLPEKVWIYNYSNYFVFKSFTCPKCNKSITMAFLITQTSIKKIFQSYTSTLLSSKEIRKFEKTKLLNEEDIREIDKIDTI